MGKSARSSTKFSGSTHHSTRSHDDLPSPEHSVHSEHSDEELPPADPLKNMGQSFSFGPRDMNDDVVIPDSDTDDEKGGGIEAAIWREDTEKAYEAGSYMKKRYTN